MLELTCLGRPTIKQNEKQIADFSSNKVFALLIYLALADKPLNRSELEGLLWGESEDQKAKTSLRSALYNINKLLGGVLETDRKTVTYAAGERTDIDLDRFEQLIADGSQADLEAACALYQGPFLDRLEIDDAPAFDHWVIALRERYRQLYFESLGKLVDLYLQQGENEAAIAALSALIELEPWQEEAHRQLMLLLAREGRFNEALRRYERCRVALQAEIGVEPMPETVTLYETIQQLRDRPPADTLPHQADRPLGRERESGAVLNRLLAPTCRLVTVTGMGGVGKTALALSLGPRLSRHFMHGVTWVSLAPLENGSFLELTILEGLGVGVPPQKSPRQHLIDILQKEERLLILDNAEHLIDACAELVTALLAASPRLSILVTSREPLALRDEHLVRLWGLVYSDQHQSDGVDGPALLLFVERAKQIEFSFQLNEADRSAVRKICQMMDGLPLGIELAAAQTAHMSCPQIEAQLAARLTDLELSLRDLPPRQRSLRALLEHSWQLLGPEERRLLAALSVFRGRFSQTAAIEICGATSNLLAALLRKSLLARDGDRYDLHGVVESYAAGKLSAERRRESLQAAHSGYFCTALREATGERPRSDRADFKELHGEWYNIQAAWEYLVETAAWHALGHTAHPLAQFLESNNRFQEGLLLFERSLERLGPKVVENGPEAARAHAIVQNRYAVQLVRTGQIPQALETTDGVITTLEEMNEPLELGFALNLNGACCLLTSDFERAIDRFERCAALYLALEVPEALKPLINLGSLYMRTGRYEMAIETLKKAIPQAESADDLRGLAHIHNNLAASSILLRRFEEALRYCDRCIELCDQITFHTVKIVALQNRAEIYLNQEAYRLGLASAESSIDLAREIGAKTYELSSLKWGMLAARYAEDREKRDRYLAEGYRLAVEADAPSTVLDWLAGVILLLDGSQDVGEHGQDRSSLLSKLLRLLVNHPATQKPTLTLLEPLLIREKGRLSAEREAEMTLEIGLNLVGDLIGTN